MLKITTCRLFGAAALPCGSARGDLQQTKNCPIAAQPRVSKCKVEKGAVLWTELVMKAARRYFRAHLAALVLSPSRTNA